MPHIVRWNQFYNKLLNAEFNVRPEMNDEGLTVWTGVIVNALRRAAHTAALLTYLPRFNDDVVVLVFLQCALLVFYLETLCVSQTAIRYLTLSS